MTTSNSKNSNLPGKGLFGWLGRQIGYVTQAVKHDPELVAKKQQIEEKTDPSHPGLIFRRTVTDEVRHEPRRLDGPADKNG